MDGTSQRSHHPLLGASPATTSPRSRPGRTGECRLCARTQAKLPAAFASMSGAAKADPGRRALWCTPPLCITLRAKPLRRADGIYDRMRPVGAHEVLVENPRHDRHLWNCQRRRDRPVSAAGGAAHSGPERRRALQVRQHVQGPRHQCRAGIRASLLPADCHYLCAPPHSLRTARQPSNTSSKKSVAFSATSLPRRRSRNCAHLESRGDFIALCPYAPRVPYETWILPRTHEAAFERMALSHPGAMRDLGACSRTLQRIRTITESFHLVLHTSPNSLHRFRPAWDTGRPSTTTTTGTSKSCPSSPPSRSPTRLRRFIIRQSLRRRRSSACARRPWIFRSLSRAELFQPHPIQILIRTPPVQRQRGSERREQHGSSHKRHEHILL